MESGFARFRARQRFGVECRLWSAYLRVVGRGRRPGSMRQSNAKQTWMYESMNRAYTRIWLLLLMGAMAFLVLQWHFSHAWAGYYSRFPWRGYEQTMREGHVPAFLTTSPRSLLVGSCILFSLPFLTLWFGFGRPLLSGLALWAGVMVSLVGVWVATPRLRQDSSLWPIDIVFLLFNTGLPLMAGALGVLAIQKARERRKCAP